MRKAVVNSVIQVRVIPRAPIQDCLGTDRLCVLDVGICTRDRHLEAVSALVLDNYDYNFRVSLLRLFDIGSVVLAGLMRELKNTLNYQGVQAVSSYSPIKTPRIILTIPRHRVAEQLAVTFRGQPPGAQMSGLKPVWLSKPIQVPK